MYERRFNRKRELRKFLLAEEKNKILRDEKIVAEALVILSQKIYIRDLLLKYLNYDSEKCFTNQH